MSNYLEAKLIGVSLLGSSFTAPTTTYLSLATTVASDGAFFTEVTTNIGYTRQPILWSAPTSLNDTTVVNSANVPMGTATTPWGTITHVGIYDGGTIGAGNLLFWGAVTTPRSVETNDAVSIPAGQLTVLFD